MHQVSKILYTYQLPRVQLITPDDGHSRCPKHVEFRDKIEFWILDASCWLVIRSSENNKKLMFNTDYLMSLSKLSSDLLFSACFYWLRTKDKPLPVPGI